MGAESRESLAAAAAAADLSRPACPRRSRRQQAALEHARPGRHGSASSASSPSATAIGASTPAYPATLSAADLARQVAATRWAMVRAQQRARARLRPPAWKSAVRPTRLGAGRGRRASTKGASSAGFSWTSPFRSGWASTTEKPRAANRKTRSPSPSDHPWYGVSSRSSSNGGRAEGAQRDAAELRCGDEVELSPGQHLDGDLRLAGRGVHLADEPVHRAGRRRVVLADMRRGGDPVDARRLDGAQELEAALERRRPVVHAGQHVGVKVDHGDDRRLVALRPPDPHPIRIPAPRASAKKTQAATSCSPDGTRRRARRAASPSREPLPPPATGAAPR